MKDFTGRKCLITGAASGIGKATALAMAELGARLFLTDIREELLEHVVTRIRQSGGNVTHWKAFDISIHEEVERFSEEIHREFGSMDIVMNIAGISIWGSVDRLEHKHWEKVINVNLMGPIHILECFVPRMIGAGKGGHVVNVSSAAGILALPWHAAYSASKFGLVGISEVLRYDLMRHNIGVSVICPGAVNTPLKQTVEIIGINRDHEDFKKLLRRFSEHAVSPERVASLIVDAVRKNRFMVLTSFDVKLGYWCKRKLFLAYHLAMKKMNDIFQALAHRASI